MTSEPGSPGGREAGSRRTWLQRATWPVPWPWVAGSSILIAGSTAVQMWQMLAWNYLDWPALSGLPLGTLVVTGPLVALASASIASALGHRSTPLGAGTAVRAGSRTVVAHLRGLLPSWLIAFALGIVPFLILGATRATGGHVEPVHLAAAGAALVFFAAVGYAVGMIGPRRTAPLLAVVLSLFLVALDGVTGSRVTNPWRVILPVIGSEARIGNPIDPDTWGLKVGVLLLAATALLWLSAWHTAGAYSRRYLAAAVAPTVVPVVVVMSLVSVGPLRLYEWDDTEAVCVTETGVPVCVDHGQAAALPEIAETVGRTLAVVGGPPPGLDGVSDRELDPIRHSKPLGAPDRNKRPGEPVATAWLTIHPDHPIDDWVFQGMSAYLSGRQACWGWTPEGERSLPGAPRAYSLTMYLQDRFQARDEPHPDFRRWYRTHQDRILRCDAPRLPGGVPGLEPPPELPGDG